MSELKINATSVERNESDAWLQNYADETERQHRRMAMPPKLAKIGLTSAHKSKAVLDMCCGHGEALDALYTQGFRNLSGMDLTITDELATDKRFSISQGNVTSTNFPDASFDWVTCIHSLHHLASPHNVEKFVNESWRLLRPGGRLSIIDFPGSPQIKLAFWYFRQPKLHFTAYTKYFGRIIQEEWFFLKDYLPQWPQIRKQLWEGRFEVESSTSTTFYYYLTLRKPDSTK